ncbi:MAG: glycosyltransferase family 2 protein [Anaerolineae bacterium]|nr:glycosyltransferase family 2 protein [Anaerolineae bacterium]
MPDSLPKISLVIPAYNRADLIAETIESALNQTWPFSEIIVVDDGSTDNTSAVLATYADQIVVIPTTNNGVQAARNIGIAAAKNELITLCDSDDLLEPMLAETMARFFKEHHQHDICYCNFTTFDKHKSYSDKLSQAPNGYFDGAIEVDKHFLTAIPDLYQRMLEFQPLFQSGLTFKKTFFNTIGGYDLRFKGIGAEDWEFTLRAVACGNIALCTLPFTRVRRHPGNDSANAMHMNIGEAEILEFGLQNHPNAEKYQEKIVKTIFERRSRAFDAAFALGNFDLAQKILAQLSETPLNIKFLLKRTIIRLPSSLRRALWKFSQRSN